MTKNSILSVLMLVGLSGIDSAGFAQQTALQKPPDSWMDSVSWTKEVWTQDDAQIRAVEVKADTELAHSVQPLNLVGQYRKKALLNISDAARVYGWAYVAYQVSRKTQSTDERGRLRNDLYAAMVRAADPKSYEYGPYYVHLRTLPPTPHSYRYTRLLFLLAVHQRIPNVTNRTQFLSLCQRLVARNPHDLQVKYARIEMLYHLASALPGGAKPVSGSPDEIVKQSRQMALKFSLQLQREEPRNLAVLSQLADVYYWLWDGKNNSGDLSLATYRKYLQLAPKNDPHRSYVQGRIVRIAEVKKFFRQHPKKD